MTTPRTGTALALVLAGGLLAVPSSAEPLPAELDPVVCALPADAASTLVGSDTDIDTDVTGGASWDLVDTKGKGRARDHVGSLSTDWAVEGTRCAGRTYRFTVTGSEPLGWSTTTASTADAAGAVSPVSGTTTVSADGRTATVAFVAQQETQSFTVRGATAGYRANGCVRIRLSVSAPDGTEEYGSAADLCDELSGGMSYR